MLSSDNFTIGKASHESNNKYTSKKWLCYTLFKNTRIECADNIITVSNKKNKIILPKICNDFYIEIDKNDIYIICHVCKYNFQKVFFRKIVGTYKSLVQNAINGLINEYIYKMKINGVGYKAIIENDLLKVNLNYSHMKEYKIPSNVFVSLEKNNTVIVFKSIDKFVVRSFMSKIRCIRSIYKGTGIYYENETILTKKVIKK